MDPGRAPRRHSARVSVEPKTAYGLACGEVRGGNHPIHDCIELPGLRGVLYSSPCGGAHGGDVHYLSVCGSGLLSRVCLADVEGHGATIAAVGREMHAHLRGSVDIIDERRVLARLDRRLDNAGLRAQTTAVLVTYYPPSRRLSVSYAGHPPGWLYRVAEGRWVRLDGFAPATSPATIVNLPLGTGLSPAYTRQRVRVSPGDRLLLVTDGVLDAPSPDGREFGDGGVAAVLDGHSGDHEALAQHLLDKLRAHVGSDRATHDDVTFFLAEVVDGPPGPAIWHVVKNRFLSRLRA